jgi:hypothetical protein
MGRADAGRGDDVGARHARAAGQGALRRLLELLGLARDEVARRRRPARGACASSRSRSTTRSRRARRNTSLLPLSVDQGLGVLVWSPLAAGLLTGKHRRGQTAPEGSRQARAGTSRRSATPSGSGTSSMRGRGGRGAGRDAGAGGARVAADAAGGLLARRRRPDRGAVPWRTSARLSLKLTEEELQRLNDVSRLPLIYPYWHQHNFARAAVHRGRPGAPCRLPGPALRRRGPAGV